MKRKRAEAGRGKGGGGEEEEEEKEEGGERVEKGKEKENDVEGTRQAKKDNVHPGRVRTLRAPSADSHPTGVVYWMTREQRALDNWSLLYAQDVAVANKVPLAVVFNLLPGFEGATIRHFGFMVKGLQTTAEILEEHGIPFLITQGQAVENIPRVLKEYDASHLVCDFSPLRIARRWKDDILQLTEATIYEVDAHNVVPVWVASNKQEHSARTIRSKIHARVPEFLHDYPELKAMHQIDGFDAISRGWKEKIGRVDWDSVWKYVKDNVDASVPEVDWITPGEKNAKAMLNHFLSNKLRRYDADRNNPNLSAQSDLSPYLHFGNLSPQRAILEAKKHRGSAKSGYDAFFEEAVIRRELSDNFCYHNDNYDAFDGFPGWAKETLTQHSRDEREHVYTYEQFEAADTHDELWNAAQLQVRHDAKRFLTPGCQMIRLGKMHGFMRMYWGKKILEWSSSAQEAMKIAIRLNDRFELDGRDPNGYVGCAWCVGGVHDQGWAERAVFGKVRYMNFAGCKRKFDVAAYIQKYGKNSIQRLLK